MLRILNEQLISLGGETLNLKVVWRGLARARVRRRASCDGGIAGIAS